MGGQGGPAAGCYEVEREPFLESKAVIFGVDYTGPHILLAVLCGCGMCVAFVFFCYQTITPISVSMQLLAKSSFSMAED